MPDELKQAKWVKEERGRILVEAKKEADGIVKEAENRIISMIDEHEITRKAYEQKAQIIETANEMSREISKGTKDYADNILEKVEGFRRVELFQSCSRRKINIPIMTTNEISTCSQQNQHYTSKKFISHQIADCRLAREIEQL